MISRIASCFLIAVTVAAAQDAQFRGNAGHTGIYDSRPSTLSSVAWKYDTGGPVYSSPAVAGDTIYIGSAERGLHAVAKSTGQREWRFDAKGPVHSSPAVADGLVYFASLDGNIYAVHAESGTLAWNYATGGETRFVAKGIHGVSPPNELMPDPWDFWLSSPAVENGTVYVGSGDGHLYVLDAKSGTLRWKFKTGNVVHASPAVAGGLVVFGSWDTYLYALDARTGSVIWKFKTGDDPKISNQTGIQGSAAIADGKVFFGCRDANFYALDAKSGAELWRFNNKGSWVVGSPAVLGGVVYFATSDSAKFHALDANTGKPVFSLDTGTYVFSSPAIAGDTAFFGTFDGRIRSVSLARKAYAGTFENPARRGNGPRYLTPDGAWNYQNLFTGETLDSMILGVFRMLSLGTFLSSPVLDGGTVYIGSADGNLYAIR